MSYKTALPQLLMLSAFLMISPHHALSDERFYDWENTGLPKLEVDLSALDNIDSGTQVFDYREKANDQSVTQQPLMEAPHIYGTKSGINHATAPTTTPHARLQSPNLYEGTPAASYSQHNNTMPVTLAPAPRAPAMPQTAGSDHNNAPKALRSRVFTAPPRNVVHKPSKIKATGPMVKPPPRKTPSTQLTSITESTNKNLSPAKPQGKPSTPFVQRPPSAEQKAQKPVIKQVATVRTVLPVEPIEFPEFSKKTPSHEISKAVPNIKNHTSTKRKIPENMSLHFITAESDLSSELKKQLDQIVTLLESEQEKRLELRAYAMSVDSSNSSARRLSLARALSIRSYLMEKGIRPTRVDVRALGDETDQTPIDRVDMIFIDS